MDYSKLSDQELVDLYQQEMQKRSGKGASEKGGESGGPLTGSHYGDLITRVLGKRCPCSSRDGVERGDGPTNRQAGGSRTSTRWGSTPLPSVIS
jgi:hypothetical protein